MNFYSDLLPTIIGYATQSAHFECWSLSTATQQQHRTSPALTLSAPSHQPCLLFSRSNAGWTWPSESTHVLSSRSQRPQHIIMRTNTRPMVVVSNASDNRPRYIFKQHYDEQPHAVAYVSRRLNAAKKKLRAREGTHRDQVLLRQVQA